MKAGRRAAALLGAGLCLALAAGGGRAAERVEPREVLALYHGGAVEDVYFTAIHRAAEMPLNHLGLVLRYHDMRDPLPPVSDLGQVRGVLTWFRSNAIDDPEAYLDWAAAVLDAGKRFVIMGNIGAELDGAGRPVPRDAINRVAERIGFRFEGRWAGITYDWKPAIADPDVMRFERPLPAVVPPFQSVAAVRGDAVSHLVLRRAGDPGTDSHMVVTSPRGGYIAAGFAITPNVDEDRRRWLLNPFAFFRRAFGTDGLPKPDTTTLSGRRIYYSHIDGDGWRNRTEVESYRERRPTLSSEVVLRELLEPYGDLPVTVAPVVGDLDPDWYGTEEGIAIAREIFRLPQVEAATHTYSHPFDWAFFADWTPAKEERFSGLYPMRDAMTKVAKIFSWLGAGEEEAEPAPDYAGGRSLAEAEADDEAESIGVYERPRAYAILPYSLALEIGGSLAFVDGLLPPGKRAGLIQWSGNTLPYPAAIAASRAAGARNLNGGDSRFDSEFPSYATVSPVGRQVGGQRQIYASNSNENTYTELWTARYFGFQHVVETIRNTETPIRVKPFNTYYHFYSGEKQASLNAVRRVLDYARAQALAPVAASRFAAIADGFFTTRLVALDDRVWRVEDRGALQTLRFDRATFEAVDFARSQGVIGQRHLQGSLYVALDEAHPAPVVALRGTVVADIPATAPHPYLIEGRWRVGGLAADGAGMRFAAQGYGCGAMTWWVPGAGRYAIEVVRGGEFLAAAEAGADHILAFELGQIAETPIEVSVRLAAPATE